MINYIIIFLLILTIAITSGSFLIASHLRITYKSNFFSTFLFFQVFYFTFGFYSLWGQMIVSSFLSPYVTKELLQKITDITALLGTPFIIFASLMFIKFSKEITGRKTSSVFVFCYLLINVLLILGIGLFLKKYPELKILSVIKYYYIVFNFIYILLGALVLLKKSRNAKFRYIDLRNVSFGLIIIMLFQNTVLFFYNNNNNFALAFIFSYFFFGGFVPVYIKYFADLSKLLPESEITKSFEEFCEKYEISKREKEIINEICKGYTNQQIADKLYISLQTVKDHTHRIYSKMECASRAQLIRIVNENAQ